MTSINKTDQMKNDLNTTEIQNILDNLFQELRRGTLVLCVLSQLKVPQYGYSLIQNLSEHNIEIEQNTLYPLLRRLDKLGLLSSEWIVEDSRPRRYYTLSETGQSVFIALRKEWLQMNQSIEALIIHA